jgi:hypothetical protein
VLGTRRRRRALIALAGTVVGAALLASPAAATFHLMKIREVYPAGNSSYVELQMLTSGQGAVGTHTMTSYDAGGIETHTFTFPGNVANDPDQGTILIGDSAAGSTFTVTPDFIDSALDYSPAGGAVCFDEASPPDCVAWGSFAGSLLDGSGSPASPAGVNLNKAIQRRIDRECPTHLENADDTDSHVGDFLEVTPNPRPSSVAPTETPCPETQVATGVSEGTFTNATAATFTYNSPGNATASFECKLDNEASFTDCSTPNPPPNDVKSYPGPLGEGSHTFRVRAVVGGVADPSPATRTWTVDTIPPDTNITGNPQNPTTSQSANFTFSSSEPTNATFRCKLDSAAEANCNTGANTQTTKSYSALLEGQHTFTVLAVDRAGNKDPDPAVTTVSSYGWTIDRTGPDVPIDTGPTQPTSTSSSASFTYHATELSSTFKCQLDSGTVEDCNDPGGKSYPGPLNDGQHTFHVYGLDALGNQGPTTDYTWTVDASSDPPPNTIITKAPKRKGTKRVVKVEFTADPAAGATFACQIDTKPPVTCTSPFTTPKLKYGRHTITIIATGPGGPDPSPAVATFKIVRP